MSVFSMLNAHYGSANEALLTNPGAVKPNFYPTKKQLSEDDACFSKIIKGTEPSTRFITKDSVISTFGSCFAQYISEYLITHTFINVNAEEHVFIFRYADTLVNSYTILQHLKWAHDDSYYINDDSMTEDEYDFITDINRIKTREYFQKTNVFIITLGLSEVWFNYNSGNVRLRKPKHIPWDDANSFFKIISCAENKENILQIYDIIRALNNDAYIIFTLSPVPLIATFRKEACIVANSVSKASLRVALDEVLRMKLDDDKLFYWPSYEIVQYLLQDAYIDDNRHVSKETIAFIMDEFSKYYINA